MGIGILDKSVNCDAVLVTNTSSLDTNTTVRMAWLKSISSANYEAAKQHGSAEYAGFGLFEGGYDSFDEKRSALFQEERFNLDFMESRQLLMLKVPDAAIASWRECVLAKMKGGELACWVERMDTDDGTLVIQWKPVVGMAELRNVVVKIHGGTDTEGNATVAMGNIQGEKNLMILRPQSNRSVSGTVSGTAGDSGDFSSAFYLPAIPPDDFQVLPRASMIEIPARNFNRSLNIEVGVLPYGNDVIHNAPNYHAAPNMVEYDFYVPAAAEYDLDVEYAALHSRSVQISLTQKGREVFSVQGLGEVTGGWSNQQKLTQVKNIRLAHGPATLRLSRTDVFPHIRTLRFLPS